ncbi:hypothetical protein A3Q34_18190 [Colwellia sp. PAMC 20917]|uniref:ATP-binding protein n=1 Tax=Colwellia sp. PAMC 20917 TaxID=1816218 RepID=UPI00087890DB|nr:ATP-binding protein [Colwellia sp. PAMC 20917]AOW78595.1 hypothetical protein A3Q34_18190 [Colwellia sp. PAMC 20917]
MNDLMTKLKCLCEKARLIPLFQALEKQEASPESIECSFLERIFCLLEAQIDNNHISKISRFRKAAKLRWPQASLADYAIKKVLPVKLSKLKDLAECAWVENYLHVAITGPTGAGKTHLASALADEAILKEYSVICYHFSALVRDLIIAEKAGEDILIKLQKRLIKFRVLMIDDWGIKPLKSHERHLLLELIELRERNGSLLITSLYEPSQWYECFVDKGIADSSLDRIIPYIDHIDWDKDSYRTELGRQLMAKSSKGGNKNA